VVPNVIGKSLARARKKLAKAHCRVGKITYKVSSKKRKGLVIAQRPRPRTRRPNGARIRLTLGKGPRARKR
jgi:beta-lactam-binding protein with PASTA domain